MYIEILYIVLNFDKELIVDAKIVNYDFFDDMDNYNLPISKILEVIKNKLLKKGGN